jgi:hypothetical protein
MAVVEACWLSGQEELAKEVLEYAQRQGLQLGPISVPIERAGVSPLKKRLTQTRSQRHHIA